MMARREVKFYFFFNATSRSLYPRRETRCPFYRRLGGSRCPCGRVLKISPTPGLFVFSCALFVLHPYLFLCLDCPAFCHFFFYLQHTSQTSMPPAGFEPATPASDRSQTLDLSRSATGFGKDSAPIPTIS